ncbi:MAG: ABC-type transport auxiliary lipoprotein family protein [Tibeticola sp.]
MKFIANTDRFTLGFGVFLCMGLLAGCTALPAPPQRPVVYDFGPSLPRAAVAPPAVALAPVLLAAVEAAPAFDGPALLYRDAASGVQQLRPYGLARWGASPAQLVRARLRARLGEERPVLGSGEGAAPMALRVQVEEFSQVFDAPPAAGGAASSRAVVRLRATLSDTRGPRAALLAQRVFELQRLAPSADAAGGVQALTEATDAALDELAAWLREQAFAIQKQ